MENKEVLNATEAPSEPSQEWSPVNFSNTTAIGAPTSTEDIDKTSITLEEEKRTSCTSMKDVATSSTPLKDTSTSLNGTKDICMRSTSMKETVVHLNAAGDTPSSFGNEEASKPPPAICPNASGAACSPRGTNEQNASGNCNPFDCKKCFSLLSPYELNVTFDNTTPFEDILGEYIRYTNTSLLDYKKKINRKYNKKYKNIEELFALRNIPNVLPKDNFCGDEIKLENMNKDYTTMNFQAENISTENVNPSRKSARIYTKQQNGDCCFEDYSSSSDEEVHYDFLVEEEAMVWDAYYQYGRDAGRAFTGFGASAAVRVLLELLGNSLAITSSTAIVEVGHGLFPCAADIAEQCGTAGRYVGAEISSLACVEAMKRCSRLRELVKDGEAEFVQVDGMEYFGEDGGFKGKLLMSNWRQEDAREVVQKGGIQLVVAKSTLDYFTCRMDKSGKTPNWEDDMRLPLSVVQLFDSFSTLLCWPDERHRIKGYLAFVEPSNTFKWRDHLLTVFKAIHSSSFVTHTPSQYLCLKKVRIYPKEGAIGILLEKRRAVYTSYEELRSDFIGKLKHLRYALDREDAEYLLPLKEPRWWRSDRSKRIEKLVALTKKK